MECGRVIRQVQVWQAKRHAAVKGVPVGAVQLQAERTAQLLQVESARDPPLVAAAVAAIKNVVGAIGALMEETVS